MKCLNKKKSEKVRIPYLSESVGLLPQDYTVDLHTREFIADFEKICQKLLKKGKKFDAYSAPYMDRTIQAVIERGKKSAENEHVYHQKTIRNIQHRKLTELECRKLELMAVEARIAQIERREAEHEIK